jgi:2-methylaconitate cis-trans-isomerase PrpF
VEAVEPITTVRIRMTNSDRILVAEVPVKGGKAMVDGDFAIDGVPGTGAKIAMDWSDVVGSITGKLLPTGNAKDTIEVDDVVGGITGKLMPTGNAKDAIEVDGVKYTVSIVDAGNPVVFVHAASLNMKGTESPNEIESNKSLMETIEKIRGHAAVMCGMVEKPENAKTISPYVPFFFVVSPPADYKTINGTIVKAEEIDLVARALFMLKAHKAIQVSGSLCTGAAARVPGTIVGDVLRETARTRSTINIGHPSGTFPVEAEAETVDGQLKVKRLRVFRTARRIMEGYVYVRKSVFK